MSPSLALWTVILVAWRTKSATATMAAGMVTLWIAQWLLRVAG